MSHALLEGQLSPPNTVKEALAGPHIELWAADMEKELGNMERKAVMKRVKKEMMSKGKKALRVRWVFAYKWNLDGTLKECKARLVVQGCFQKYGEDYLDVFAPVAQTKSYRVLLALSAAQGWPLAQWDVDAAYLNAKLHEEIYVRQPPGFEDGTGDVYLLCKALYGLKQAGA